MVMKILLTKLDDMIFEEILEDTILGTLQEVIDKTK